MFLLLVVMFLQAFSPSLAVPVLFIILNAISLGNSDVSPASGITTDTSTTSTPCTMLQWRCNDGTCIDKSQRCDNYQHCSDGSDEDQCSSCSSRFFQCGDRKCISKYFVCDGTPECDDHSDEANCEGEMETSCPFGNFRCKSGGCIPSSWKCDGTPECHDHSDEEDCQNVANCTEQQYQCHNKICISLEYVCDGEKDCLDGGDEANCDAARCESNPNHYRCASGTCLTPDKVCDGHKDCSDGSDEDGHCDRECKAADCTHGCFKTPQGPHCTCPAGYRLKAEVTCVDVDECSGNVSLCDHFCENKPGSYKCSCATNYNLFSDNKTCLSTSPRVGFLIVAKNTEIRKLYLDGSFHQLVFNGFNIIQSVAYDPSEARVYWSDSVAIYQKHLESVDEPTTVVMQGVQRVESMAVDWYGRNLYIADSGIKKIVICALDGLSCTVLLGNINHPRAIQLDIANRLMFWTDIENSKIERAGMDGTHRKVLVSKGLGTPNGLALDLPAKRVYWMDAKFSKVEHVNYEGNDRKHLPDGAVSHPFSAAIWENRIYWSDLSHEYIRSCLKRNGKGFQTLLKGIPGRDYYGLTLYHPSMLNQGRNPCAQRPCTHFCLLVPNSISGYTCSCPAEMSLAADLRSCEGTGNQSYPVIVNGNKFYEVIQPKIGLTMVKPWKPNIKTEKIGDLDYSPIDDCVIASDLDTNIIKKISLNRYRGGHVIDNVTAVGVAVDWLRGNIYWVDGVKKAVEVVSAFGFYRTLLVRDYIYHPTDIAVAPRLGFMFISDAGSAPSIRRCGLDGLSCTRIIDSGIYEPMSITFDRDPNIQRLYWCDREAGHIESSAVDGSQRRILYASLWRPVSLLVSMDQILWTSERTEVLYISSKQSQDTVSLDITGVQPPSYHDRVMKLVEVGWEAPDVGGVPCSKANGGCNHLCLGNNTQSEICACALGYELAKDGKSCARYTCHKNEFKCPKAVSCIPLDWRCDGTVDCEAGGDEDDCAPKHRDCTSDEFRCNSGNCINEVWKCDGQPDCEDGSDEALPECQNKTCRSGQFQCKSGECIPNVWVCDGQNECNDNSDEEGCPTGCPPHKFACNDGNCIPEMWQCDGDKDCNDGSDEVNCADVIPRVANTIPPPKCSDDEITCASLEGDDVVCVPEFKRCDGTEDCPLGDDEECRDCEAGQFKCRTGDRCIPISWKCDCNDDCQDNSDEEDCPLCNRLTTRTTTTTTTPRSLCRADEFPCRDGQCILKTQICDGIDHCDDGSDELNHCSKNCERNNGGCQHKCHSHPDGAYCSCYKGFKLDVDHYTCLNYNECDEVATCSHYCTDLKGGYVCNCTKGYTLEPDGRTCKLSDGKEWVLLVGSKEIFNLSYTLNLHSKMPLMKGLSINSLAFDPHNQAFVYTDTLGNVGMVVIDLSSSDGLKEKIIRHRSNPQGISFDSLSRYVYFSEYFVDPQRLDSKKVKVTKVDQEPLSNVHSVIQACNLETGGCTQIYRAFNVKIPSTQVSSTDRKLFYCTNHLSRENQAQIISSDLDGTGRKVLHQTKVVRCGSLAIDEPKKSVYWTDTALNTVECVSWDGTKHRIVKTGAHFPVSLLLEGDWMMWYNFNGNQMVRCNKYNNLPCTKILLDNDGSNKFNALVGIYPHEEHDNKCNEKNCSQLCTVVREAECMCHVGYVQSEEDPSVCLKDTSLTDNPCGVGVCELLSNINYVCRCPFGYSGVHCEVQMDLVKKGSNLGIAVSIVLILLFIVIAFGIYWYKKQPFIIWKAKGRRANQTFRFSNPAFGVMSDTPIVTNSPAPSSCPSQGNNPPPYVVTNPDSGTNFENPFFKAEEHQVNTSIDSAVVSGTDSTSINIAPHLVNLDSPLPPHEQLLTKEKNDWVLSPYNPPPL